ncbi:acyltransferase family protein [Streptomyces sp. NPDC058299]|uniref:acyltransferase family protein n=1 Tax=Streptomyces sp. NPDC058299 TaxID=3346435 RepID=UPI0036E7CCA8
MRALDGLRGLAVAAVLAYHGGIPWASGGFLGVDAFLVLSGYLITTLLLTEWARTGGIALGSFWARRMRRLLPALTAMLLVVCVLGPHLMPAGDLAGTRGDALAALAYVANWRMIFHGTDYFAQTAAPPLLQHTWSLGIEEQFYLLWPLLAAGVLRACRSRGAATRVLLLLTAGGVLASAAVCLALIRGPAGLPRVYFGSDTRALALLLGCAVAVLPARSPASTARGARQRILAGTAALGAVALGWLWSHADGADPRLYPAGLLAGSLATAAVLTHTIRAPASVTARLLSLPPLAALGRISYGVYLWHWPLFAWIDAERTGLRGAALFGVRVVVTLVVAVVSFVAIERPVQRGHPRFLRRRAPALAATATCMAAVAATAVAALPPGPRLTPSTTAPAEATAPAEPGHRSDQVPDRSAGRHRRAGTPVSAVIMGDSIAWTLVNYLPPTPDVTLHDSTRQGCGLALDSPYRYFGAEHRVSRECRHWPSDLRQAVTRHDPDTVVLLFGRWETMDRVHDGRWTHTGDKAFDAYLLAQLDRAVGIASAHGAKVLLATEPYNHRGERPDGGVWPEDQPQRVDHWNQLLRQVAGRHRGTADILDLGRRLCPHGAFTWQVDGVQVRSDGVHLTPEGARWLQPWLVSRIEAAAH